MLFQVSAALTRKQAGQRLHSPSSLKFRGVPTLVPTGAKACLASTSDGGLGVGWSTWLGCCCSYSNEPVDDNREPQ
jgi:hypothetical protein